MNPSTTEAHVEQEVLLERIRDWEKELADLSLENGHVVLKVQSDEDKKLVDHFENQFTIQLNRLDKMKHQLKISGGSEYLEMELKEFSVLIDKLRADFIAFSEEFD
jgi:hypothetical protein